MAPASRKFRPQSARLDILSVMAATAHYQRSSSPTDSLSPCREDFPHDQRKRPLQSTNDESQASQPTTTGPDEDDWFQNETACPTTSASRIDVEAGTPGAQTNTQQQPASHVPEHKQSPPATPSHTSTPAREPRSLLSRSHRPANLSVDGPNGASSLPAYELKQAIRGTDPNQEISQAVVSTPASLSPERGRPRHRRTPALHLNDRSNSEISMGNQHSHHISVENGAIDDSDANSTQSVLRASRTKAARMPRRSSMNVFKRLDGKSPLHPELTGTVIEVPRAATAPNLDGMADDDEYQVTEDEQERSRARHAHRHSAPSPSMPMPRESPTATLTEERASRPLSASDTITDQPNNTQAEGSVEDEESPMHLRVSALSPTLPAPSPIPEDSPHKYGLKDRMETPDEATPPPAPDIEVSKARRRSSGFAIFNEARTLQSASSFLNGLSTARRRAESRAQSRNATDNSTSANTVVTPTSAYTSATPSFINLPTSATASTIHPYSSISHTALPQPATEADLDLNIDTTNRNLGHQFKSSGFAYAPPLSFTQIKCYRSHTRLLPSRNKYAQVECAVCHADDEGQFWSCSWCALRMCTRCRKTLESGGVAGLRERVRVAEIGVY